MNLESEETINGGGVRHSNIDGAAMQILESNVTQFASTQHMLASMLPGMRMIEELRQKHARSGAPGGVTRLSLSITPSVMASR